MLLRQRPQSRPAGSIFACWFCASFIGLPGRRFIMIWSSTSRSCLACKVMSMSPRCNLPHEQNEQDRFMGKAASHGYEMRPCRS